MGTGVKAGDVWYPRLPGERAVYISNVAPITNHVVVWRIWCSTDGYNAGPAFFLTFSELKRDYMPPTKLHKFLEGVDEEEG